MSDTAPVRAWTRRLLPIAALVFAAAPAVCLDARAQDLSTFLSHPPAPGAWAHYVVETRNPAAPGTPKVEPFDLAVTGAQPLEGEDHIWLEASPMDLAKDRDGTLRLLLKAAPSRDEALNPFRQTRGAWYRPKSGDPYALTSSAVTFLRNQFKDVKVTQERTELPAEEQTVPAGPTYRCTKVHLVTRIAGEVFFQRRTVVEEGTYWFSADTPFLIVRAEIRRTETRGSDPPRVRDVSVSLRAGAFAQASSAFPTPPTRTRGLFSLLLH